MEGEEKKRELDVHTTTINQMNTTNVSIQCGDSLAKLENMDLFILRSFRPDKLKIIFYIYIFFKNTWKIEKHVLK
jgi:hypothetical protein